VFEFAVIYVNLLALQESASPHLQGLVGVKIPTVRILMREIFSSPADELYSIFTTKEVSRQYF